MFVSIFETYLCFLSAQYHPTLMVHFIGGTEDHIRRKLIKKHPTEWSDLVSMFWEYHREEQPVQPQVIVVNQSRQGSHYSGGDAMQLDAVRQARSSYSPAVSNPFSSCGGRNPFGGLGLHAIGQSSSV